MMLPLLLLAPSLLAATLQAASRLAARVRLRVPVPSQATIKAMCFAHCDLIRVLPLL